MKSCHEKEKKNEKLREWKRLCMHEKMCRIFEYSNDRMINQIRVFML